MRQSQDSLEGYSFQVQHLEAQEVDPKNGQPLFNGDGSPKMVERIMLVFIDEQIFGKHAVVVPLTGENRDELVRQLTGGVVIASSVPTL